MIKITLSDGTVLENIRLNGTTFVSNVPLDESIFENNMSPVDIEWVGDPERSYIYPGIIDHHDNMLYQPIVSPIEGEYWFGLSDISKTDMEFAKDRADIEYLAMMMDITL